MKRRIRVLLVLEWYGAAGGIEVFVRALAERLPAEIDGAVAATVMGPHRVRGLKVPVYELPRQPMPKQLREVISKFGPDVVHLQNLTPPLTDLALMGRDRGTAIVRTMHQVPENTVSGAQAQGWWLSERLMAARCARIVAPSSYVSRVAAAHGIGTEVLSCGVDLSEFRPGDQMAALRRLGLGEGPIVLFVGRFGGEKNGGAVARAIEALPDVRLVMVGPQPDWSDQDAASKVVSERLRRQGRLEMPGFVEHAELVSYYQAADVVVVPSDFETQSLVTLEALACGVPVVASDRGALPDMVKPGENGWLCEPVASDIARALKQALASNLQVPPVSWVHDVRHVADRYTQLYYQATQKAPHRGRPL